MKRLAIAFFLLSALILALVTIVNSLTTGMAKTADEFLIAVSEDRIDTAMNYLSTGFRNTVAPEEFKAYLKTGGLDKYEIATWDSRSYSRSQGEIEGVVYLDDGSVQPLRLVFVQEQDEWRIQSIEAKLPGISPRAMEKGIPPLSVLERMTTDTIGLFGQCVLSGDFDPFQAEISALWQSRTSPARLLQAFKPFVDRKMNLAEYASAPPVFSQPPALDEDGNLRIKGYFPHEAGTLAFDLTYTFEYPEWKLLGLNVSL